MKPRPQTVVGYRVELAPGPFQASSDGVQVTVKLTRLWWAPFALAWVASGMVRWYARPLVFFVALWALLRDRGVE